MAGVRDERLGAVIDRFYEAATRPDLWQAVLEEYAAALGADGAVLLPAPAAPLAPANSPDLEEVVDVGLRDGWLGQNQRIARGLPLLRDPQRVVTESDIFTPRELDHLPFNAEYIGRQGFRWFAGLHLVPDGPRSVILSAERRRQREMFSRGEIEAIARAVPHLQRAGQIAQGLAAARAAGMIDAFETMGFGGILLDRGGTVLSMTERAQAHLGRGLVVTRGALLTQHPAAAAALGALIGSLLHSGPAHENPPLGPVGVPRPDGPPLVVHGAPLARGADAIFQRAQAILLVTDPQAAGRPATALLRQVYGLTAAEARLAQTLADGSDLAAVADRLGVTVETARSQLKAVFSKTGTHRQPALVALLARFSL
ncbi:helix-turn-helix transcriptional regulator [Methylobacterium oryzisoli]|uniref:helix-turn-helix transcriptional regulator n=1 Tax=Methylobacterium oryzisoli TaxID=3385502 RepID=UPI0038926809